MKKKRGLKEKILNLWSRLVDVHAALINTVLVLIVIGRIVQIGLSGSGWISLIIGAILWFALVYVFSLEYLYPRKNKESESYSLGPGVILIVLAILSASVDCVTDDEVAVIRGNLVVESQVVFLNPFNQQAEFYDSDLYREIDDFSYKVEFDKNVNIGVNRMLNKEEIPDSLFVEIAKRQLKEEACNLKSEGISKFRFGVKGSLF